jgi:PLP dependent protein
MSVENLRRIQQELKDLGKSEVRIIAVTKTYGHEVIDELLHAGHRDFGENRYSEARDKIPLVDLSGVAKEKYPIYHHIGPLQSGGARQIPGLFTWVHGSSSLSAIESLADAALKKQTHMEESGQLEDHIKIDLWPMKYLIQLNLTGESSKLGGMTLDEFKTLVSTLPQNDALIWRGFMTMGPSSGDLSQTAEVFHQLRDIRNEFLPGGELSMGMSHDYHMALEYDATMIRVGSVLFGKRV